MPKLTALISCLKSSNSKCNLVLILVHFLMIRRFIQTSKWGVLKMSTISRQKLNFLYLHRNDSFDDDKSIEINTKVKQKLTRYVELYTDNKYGCL